MKQELETWYLSTNQDPFVVKYLQEFLLFENRMDSNE